MKRYALSCLLCTTVLFLAYPQSAHTQHYDVVIAGGHVLDGSGNPWIRADVGIRGVHTAVAQRQANKQAQRHKKLRTVQLAVAASPHAPPRCQKLLAGPRAQRIS